MAQELYELPEGWDCEPLGDLCRIEIGRTPPRSNKTFFQGNLPWLTIADLNAEVVSTSKECLTTEAVEGYTKKLVRKGTLLMSFKLTLGKLAFAGVDLYTNEAIAALPIRDDSKLYNRYLFFVLKFIDLEEEVDNAVKGKTLNKSKLQRLRIPVPPLEEQQRIVAQFDALFSRIDQSIAQLQHTLAQTKALWASALEKMRLDVTNNFPMKKVGDLIETIQTGTTPPKKESRYYNDASISWFAPSDLGKSKDLVSSRNKINQSAIHEGKAKIFPNPSLLLVAIGATVGKIGLLKFEGSSNQQITALNFKKGIFCDFAYYWFEAIKTRIINDASAATLPIINQKGIRALPMVLPPLAEQEKIVAHLDAISERTQALEAATTRQIEQLNTLKASLLDAAFRGQL